MEAFLHGILEIEVYMRQLLRFKSASHQNYVCKLQKSIYGLRQSPRVWFQQLCDFLISIGFKESLSDQSLFIFSDNKVMGYFFCL